MNREPEARAARRSRRLDYLCLQPTRQGQASYAHVNEIVGGLRRRGWAVRLIETAQPRAGRFDGVRRAIAAAVTQLGYWARSRFRPAPVVYIRFHFLSLPTAVVARAAGSTVIQEVNSGANDAYDMWPGLRPLHRLLSWTARIQLRWADAAIAVSAPIAAYVDGLTGRPGACHVVGNGADIELFSPSRRGDPPDRPYAVFVGALASWQGVDVALAAATTPAWPAGVDLVIVGDGRERERVLAATRSHDHIRWLGTIPYREVGAVIAGSLAALVPTSDLGGARVSPSPVKLYEALASGVPVVASDIAGVGEIVRAHGCGLVFPSGDALELARRVADLAGDPGLAAAMGARGRAAAVERYSWDVRAAQTEAVIEQTLEARANRAKPAPRRS
ncbi:MAG: glycosyltransferase family 4 protein [Candidatus Limnocylindrales bacterium]